MMLRRFAVMLVLAMMFPLTVVVQGGHSGPGTHFGAGNVPMECSTKIVAGSFADGCYHMRTGLNHLDTPIIDVLIVPPATPYPERDLRVMRQSIEMWDAGIHHLAGKMGLDWLKEGVEFNIFVDDDEFTTHPLWDPEIIVVATNPVGGIGIGIDPFGLKGPCKGANPLASFEVWEQLPGFDRHHEGHSGTYAEACEGGGTTCYAINAAIDPAPGLLNIFTLFDLVSHEVGHCLSIGHVGDALDHKANVVPSHDIMAYADQDHTKCVSTLDVEGFALRMSRFLLDSPLKANDGVFQIQHPDDHYYASTTGAPTDCPQADVGMVPGKTVDFTPRDETAFSVTLGGPSEVTVGETATFSVTTQNAAGDATCTISAEGAPQRENESSDGCTADLTWSSEGEYTVSAEAEDGTGTAHDASDVRVTPAGLPAPDGSIVGGIVIFPFLSPVAYHEAVGILIGDVDPVPKFAPGEFVRLQTRATVDSGGPPTAGPDGDAFTWHIWSSDGALIDTVSCLTSEDRLIGGGSAPDQFNCVAHYTMPLDVGRYYTTLRFDADDRWVCDRPDKGPLGLDLQVRPVPPCLKAFDIGVDTRAIPAAL